MGSMGQYPISAGASGRGSGLCDGHEGVDQPAPQQQRHDQGRDEVKPVAAYSAPLPHTHPKLAVSREVEEPSFAARARYALQRPGFCGRRSLVARNPAWSCSSGRSYRPEQRGGATPAPRIHTSASAIRPARRDGPCWARTSDPQLVERILGFGRFRSVARSAWLRGVGDLGAPLVSVGFGGFGCHLIATLLADL